MTLLDNHKVIERNVTLLLVLSLLVVCVGGIVEVVPLFFFKNTIEKVAGMRPYTPLELAGRNIYVREGCYTCHSQMIRPLRDEVQRYGHYSLAAESMYDHPFQWGSERQGPDLARVGGRYSNDWQVEHLTNPRSVVPESIMPTYGYLARTPLADDYIADDLVANARVGVPYTADMIAKAKEDVVAQASVDGDKSELLARYPKARSEDFDGNPMQVTEMDALVAYLQMLGTLVDFKNYDENGNNR
jgi:cytochrome c oxidase cbb3-type subunit 2